MDGFGDNFDQPEVDPAAEFIAREQNDLAGLDDDLTPAAPAPGPAVSLSNDDPFGLPQIQDGDQDPFASFGQSEVDQVQVGFNDMKISPFDVEVDSVDQFSQVENGVMDEQPLQDVLENFTEGQISLGDAPSESQFDNGETAEDETPSPAHRPTVVREEPEKIKKWREEQKQRLEEKDANEEKKREEWREVAKKELEEWYRHHDDLIAKTRAANRYAIFNAEKQFVADDDEIEPGTEWERIAKHCDFNPKASKGSKDVSRMRSIILQLKQNPLPVNGFGNKRS
ncbi:hypothetical protein ONE63_006411 [Megalurothrips usitatus]|uniref:Clathrin light chain n=1 Tax=Megalurothrips usitatus TaxID=439358 RepID=A0AAV7XXG3_9NEOP|nr:hypothetical protein ONE63_006411 [Megalurothrips usitatus]